MLGACAALLSQLGSCQLSSQLGSVYLLAWILDPMLSCRGLLGVSSQMSLRGPSCAACWGCQQPSMLLQGGQPSVPAAADHLRQLAEGSCRQCGWTEAHTKTWDRPVLGSIIGCLLQQQQHAAPLPVRGLLDSPPGRATTRVARTLYALQASSSI